MHDDFQNNRHDGESCTVSRARRVVHQARGQFSQLTSSAVTSPRPPPLQLWECGRTETTDSVSLCPSRCGMPGMSWRKQDAFNIYIAVCDVLNGPNVKQMPQECLAKRCLLPTPMNRPLCGSRAHKSAESSAAGTFTHWVTTWNPRGNNDVPGTLFRLRSEDRFHLSIDLCWHWRHVFAMTCSSTQFCQIPENNLVPLWT